MLNILCYGDSNTWGQVPGADTDRFQRQDRWPQVMASHLGDGYEVFEAGLSGRTTTFDRPPRQWRNGRDLLVPTLETYSPLDLVIILLGTNDVSLPYLSVADITAGAGELVEIVRSCQQFGPEFTSSPVPLLVAPHLVGPLGPEDAVLAPGAEEKSRALVDAYRTMATTIHCDFADLSGIVDASPRDPWHWEVEGQHAAGTAIAEKVQRILKASPS